ncbi:hypothetical protein BDP81DRAFT_27704 [Colletotrichum phormii]|uniref:Uncharacterized protein n=1 Tax=Colletotrichum phormii TaxID=359342 RepID=A0AAJ0EH92_9PEZI|nr:uncharacterized protein BDP81DRAFT_27704 [Colletotrichum phormii]KAK1636745.1 hypothetical protein BDP81DRAFT_27704 [Colletotrichum phormii]
MCLLAGMRGSAPLKGVCVLLEAASRGRVGNLSKGWGLAARYVVEREGGERRVAAVEQWTLWELDVIKVVGGRQSRRWFDFLWGKGLAGEGSVGRMKVGNVSVGCKSGKRKKSGLMMLSLEKRRKRERPAWRRGTGGEKMTYRCLTRLLFSICLAASYNLGWNVNQSCRKENGEKGEWAPTRKRPGEEERVR